LALVVDFNGREIEVLFQKCSGDNYSRLQWLVNLPSREALASRLGEAVGLMTSMSVTSAAVAAPTTSAVAARSAVTPSYQLPAANVLPSVTNGPSEMKNCPDCAESVRADARLCRFCRHSFGP